MTDAIIHLILIQSNEQIGMDEITRRIATALSGDVIQLVPVIVPKPIPPPPVVVPPPVIVPVKLVRLKNAANTVNVRSSPEVLANNVLGSMKGKDEYPLLREDNKSWYGISFKDQLGWVSKTYTVII